MSDIDITLYLNEYRVRALAEALGSQTAETVEDKLTEAFDTLYQDYVPDELRATIEAKIEREDAVVQARLEADRRFAVYHIRENGEDCHFTSDYFRTPLQAAYRYRLYERGELSSNPETFADALLKRILSALNTSARSVRISMQTTESLHCSNLIWTKVGSVFTTARITNGRHIRCMIFPLRLTRHSARITVVTNAAVRFSTAASLERKWSCRRPMTKPRLRRCRCDRHVSPCVAPCGEMQPESGKHKPCKGKEPFGTVFAPFCGNRQAVRK